MDPFLLPHYNMDPFLLLPHCEQRLLRCMREFSGGISQKAVFCVALYFGLSDASLTSAELAGFFLLVNDLLGTFEAWRHHYHILESEFGGIERFMTLMEAKPSVVGGERRVGEIFSTAVSSSKMFALLTRRVRARRCSKVSN